MRASIATDREFFDSLMKHEGLRKLRVLYDDLAGHPLWWTTFRFNDSHATLHRFIENSYEIWNDPRLKKFRFTRALWAALRPRAKEMRPFLLQAPAGLRHFVVPLVLSGRVIGYFGLSGLRKETRTEILNLLALQVELIVSICSKEEELKRLSATIRPRAIALSTVHTVHRIINSTLNLEELISRLAHLTAQVLRANRCTIYLVERSPVNGVNGKAPAPRALIRKAAVGYAKGREPQRKVGFGGGIEGRVAQTARHAFRRNLVCIPLIDEDVVGVLTVADKKDKKEFTHFDVEILTTLAEEAVIAIKNAQLYEEQKRVTLGTIQSLAVILGTRVNNLISPDVFLRVALRMAQEMRLGEEDTQALHYATLLKDTAKIGIPDEILKKPTKLTGEEYRLLREHPLKGAKIVQSFESLKPVVPIILYSREKFDGTGYPKGLRGEKIPVGARILSVINAFEAIIMGRPYRDRSTLDEALDEIERNSGTQFDPKVVEIFCRTVRREGFPKLLERNLGKKKHGE